MNEFLSDSPQHAFLLVALHFRIRFKLPNDLLVLFFSPLVKETYRSFTTIFSRFLLGFTADSVDLRIKT